MKKAVTVALLLILSPNLKAQERNNILQCQSKRSKKRVCSSKKPEPNHCNNGRKDEKEIDIDCGGKCPPCEIGKKCKKDRNCKSRNCKQGQCRAPGC